MSLIASNKYTLVYGLGLTGKSAARFLLAQGVKTIAVDTRNEPPGLAEFKTAYPDLTIVCGEIDEELVLNASEIVISPGMSRKQPIIQKAFAAGISVVGDIELFARRVQAPVIAITGTNGKSTVTTLVGEMAKACGLKTIVAGNIGEPVLDTLDQPADIYVLELSSFQLESTYSLKPTAATILNVSDDHLDRYNSFMEYALTKQRIAFGAKTLVINKQEVLTTPPLAASAKQIKFTNTAPDLHEYGLTDTGIAKGFTELVRYEELKLQGRHNLLNAAAALALAEAANLPIQSCIQALKAFSGLAHRCEFVAKHKGVTFINDSKATNVGATIAAIEGLGSNTKNLHVILGGDGKGANFSPLIQALGRTTKSIATLGKDGKVIAETVGAALPDLLIQQVKSLEEAVLALASKAEAGDIVLLSPACASLDMFKNFEVRGEIFFEAVRGLSYGH